MTRKQIGFLILAFILCGIIFYAYKEFHRTNEDLANATESFKLKSIDFIKEFKGNDSIASKKYLGKIIAIEGVLTGIDKNPAQRILIIKDSTSGIAIRCAIDPFHIQEISSLNVGDYILLKGLLTGYSADVTGLLGADINLTRGVARKTSQ